MSEDFKSRQTKHAEEVRTIRSLSRVTGRPYSDLKRFAQSERLRQAQQSFVAPVPQADPAPVRTPGQLAESVTFQPRPFGLSEAVGKAVPGTPIEEGGSTGTDQDLWICLDGELQQLRVQGEIL